MGGSITLGEVGEHTPVLVVACDRAGHYRLETLIDRHGEGFGIPKLLLLLSKDCPKRNSITVYDLCGVHCPELPSFFLDKRTDPTDSRALILSRRVRWFCGQHTGKRPQARGQLELRISRSSMGGKRPGVNTAPRVGRSEMRTRGEAR